MQYMGRNICRPSADRFLFLLLFLLFFSYLQINWGGWFDNSQADGMRHNISIRCARACNAVIATCLLQELSTWTVGKWRTARSGRRLYHVHMAGPVATHVSVKGGSFVVLLPFNSESRMCVHAFMTLAGSCWLLTRSLCHFLTLSTNRVIRAFLIEEQKIVKKVLAEKSKKSKKEA
jgi:hypothetical protein